MSDAIDPAAHAAHTTPGHAAPAPLSYANATTPPAGLTAYSPLVRLGGGLGIAGTLVGLAIMLAMCAGFGAASVLSLIPIGLGAVGLVIALIGSWTQKDRIAEDTHVLQALFVNAISIVGGVLEMAVWLNWELFAK